MFNIHFNPKQERFSAAFLKDFIQKVYNRVQKALGLILN